MIDKEDLDHVGHWSEIKLEIVRKYATAYSTILSKHRFRHYYIDAFAGAGVHVSKTTGDFIPGSPLNALNVDPPFRGYFFVDLDGDKAESLRVVASDRKEVKVFNGDCNKILVRDVFPLVRWEDYCRALCLLDPYGLHLNWQVVEAAAKSKSIEIFLNFPILDINRNVLLRDREKADAKNLKRMDLFWGDESWRDELYDKTGDLFGYPERLVNDQVVAAFVRRLKKVAGFKHVSEPMPMRNTKGATVYYLIFASQKPVAAEIVKDIIAKYRDRGA